MFHPTIRTLAKLLIWENRLAGPALHAFQPLSLVMCSDWRIAAFLDHLLWRLEGPAHIHSLWYYRCQKTENPDSTWPLLLDAQSPIPHHPSRDDCHTPFNFELLEKTSKKTFCNSHVSHEKIWNFHFLFPSTKNLWFLAVTGTTVNTLENKLACKKAHGNSRFLTE